LQTLSAPQINSHFIAFSLCENADKNLIHNIYFSRNKNVMAQYWNNLLLEAAAYDAEKLTRQKRINSGLKNYKTLQVFMTIQDSNERGPCGFCCSEYELPFDEKQMKADIREWTEYKGGKYVVKVEKTDIKPESGNHTQSTAEVASGLSNTPVMQQEKKEQEPHWPPSEVIDRDLAIRLHSQANQPFIAASAADKNLHLSESDKSAILSTSSDKNLQTLSAQQINSHFIADPLGSADKNLQSIQTKAIAAESTSMAVASGNNSKQQNIWMRLATWYWQNLEKLRKEAMQESLISNQHEYPRAIVYWTPESVVYTLFHCSNLLNSKLDKVHGKNMGLPCLIMP
jgi:hypothetical protein